MSHDARLDRLEGSIAPDQTPEPDAAIEREFEAIRRNFPDKGEEMIATIIAECDPANRTPEDRNG